MTLILCEKHGTSEFFESCEHIEELIKNGNLNAIKTIRAYLYKMKVCESCIKMYKLEKYVLDPAEMVKLEQELEPESFWNEFESAYDEMSNRTAWCNKCYEELISLKNENT